MKKILKMSCLASSVAAFSTSAQAALVTFDFANTSTGLDGAAAGAIMSVTENGETVVLSSLTISAPDFNEVDPYNNLITVGHETNVANNSGAGGLGINNETTGNTDFNTLTGAGSSESSNLNFLESVTFELDQTVTFATIDFASIGGSVEFLRINVEGVLTNYDFFDGNTSDIFADPLSGLVITAGTDITFTALGAAGDTNLRIDEFTVDTIPTVIPEPSSTALLGLGGLALILRRRK